MPEKQRVPDPSTIAGSLYRSFTPGTYTEEKDDKGSVTQRKVRAVFASENPVEVYDWGEGERIREVLLMNGMKIPDNKQVPLLDNHSRWEGSVSVKGSARNMQAMDNGTAEADIFFSSLANDQATLAREGHLTDLSVGYKTDPKATTWIEPGMKANVGGNEYDNSGSTLRCAIRTTWYPFEISTTPIGADARAKFREALDINQPSQRSAQMPDQVVPVVPATPASVTADQEKIRAAAAKEAAEAERARIDVIQTTARELNIDEDFYRAFINDGMSEVEARTKLVTEAQKRMKAAPQGAPDFRTTADETDKIRDGALTGLLLRSGYPESKLNPEAVKKVAGSEFRSGSVVNLAKYCLVRAGMKGIEYADNATVAREILNVRATVAQGTGDFSYILAAAVNKFLMKGYEEENTTWQMWCGKQPLNDFKINKMVNLSGFSDMEKIPEGENPKWGRFSDKGEYITLFKIGKAFVLSFEAIVNDDKNAFSRIPEGFARSIARKKERAVYAYLYRGNTDGTGSGAVGPTMNEDGQVMFYSTHNNIGTTAAPSTTSLSEARKLLRQIKLLAPDPTSVVQYSNAPVKFIITGTTQEAQWEMVLQSPTAFTNSTANNTQPNPYIVNPFKNSGIVLVTTPILDEYSTTVWYAAADSNVAQHIVVASLAGEEAPQIRSEPSEIGQARGIVWDCISIFTVGASDWRGLIKNAGA